MNLSNLIVLFTNKDETLADKLGMIDFGIVSS